MSRKGGEDFFLLARKTSVGLEEAHRDLRISPDEFDEVAAELGRTLDFVRLPFTNLPKLLRNVSCYSLATPDESLVRGLVNPTFGLQVLVACQGADRLLDLALRLIDLSLTFVLALTSVPALVNRPEVSRPRGQERGRAGGRP